MPLTTWSSIEEMEERTAACSDAEIREAVARWPGYYVQETIRHPRRRWFQRHAPKPEKRYTIYVDYSGTGADFQIISFAPLDDDDWSINSSASAQTILAYFYGMDAGFKIACENEVET